MADPSAPPPIVHLQGRIVLGHGREYSDVWSVGGKLHFRRPTVSSTATEEIEGWVFPGLVDVHCHLGLGPQGAVDHDATLAQARADRDAGVLVVRDAGSPADTRWIQSRDDLPRLVRAGKHLARPKRYLRGYGLELTDPGDLPAQMGTQARDGDGWVKLVADWIDRDLGEQGDLTPLWTRQQLTDGIDAAHREAARVTAHVFSHEALPDLLAAGIDGIEHGTGIGEEHLDTIVERGIPVTPTLLQIGQFDAIAAQAEARYPKFAARMRRLHERRYEQVRMLHEAGVRLLIGTDSGGTIEHGNIAQECAELVRAGVPAADVVAAATWLGRQFLGLGALIEGASADVVVFDADPREDITVLRRPKAVVLRGKVMTPGR